MKQANGQKRRYSTKFKQAAVARLAAGESATAIAKDMEIRRKFLYAWRDEARAASGVKHIAEDPQEQLIAQQQQKIAELERLAGKQAAQLDFFDAALRATKESRPNRSVDSGDGSTRRSKN